MPKRLRLPGEHPGQLAAPRDDHPDRSPPAAGADIERLMPHAREFHCVLDPVIVLGARPRSADRVALLAGVLAQERPRFLPHVATKKGARQSRCSRAAGVVGGSATAGSARSYEDLDLSLGNMSAGIMPLGNKIAHQRAPSPFHFASLIWQCR